MIKSENNIKIRIWKLQYLENLYGADDVSSTAIQYSIEIIKHIIYVCI